MSFVDKLKFAGQCLTALSGGLTCGTFVASAYVSSVPENYVTGEAEPSGDKFWREKFSLVERDAYLRRKREKISALLLGNNVEEQNQNKGKLVLVSGPYDCGRQEVIHSVLADESVTLLELCGRIPITQTLSDRLGAGVTEQNIWPVAFLANTIIKTSYWRNKYMKDEDEAYEMVSRVVNTDDCNTILIRDFSGRQSGKIVEWVLKIIRENPVTVIIDSNDQAFAAEELSLCANESGEQVPFEHIQVGIPSRDGDLSDEEVDEALTSRILSIFKLQEELSYEKILDDVIPIVGLRLSPLIDISEMKPNNLIELRNAVHNVVLDEAERIKSILLLSDGKGVDSADEVFRDLSAWTWTVLEAFTGASGKLESLQDTSQRVHEASLPPLPASVSMNNQAKVAAVDVSRLSFYLLESIGIPTSQKQFPCQADENATPKLISVPPLTKAAFKELLHDHSAISVVEKWRKAYHRKEDLARLELDLQDYIDRRDSYERSVKYFFEHVRDQGRFMDQKQFMEGKLEIDRVGRILDTEMAVLEARKESILFAT